MANISSLLEIIRTAHLGRDMRQALHDSIQAVNNDTETALGKSLTFTNATRKLSLKAKDGTVLSEAVIPGGGSGGGSVDTVNGVAPDENGNVQLTASDVGAMSSSAGLNDISDVTLSSPSNGQVLGYDGSKWKNVNAPSGGGGHTIKNESGTALTQRANLQFKGCAVSDDSTNNATVVSVQTSNRNLLDNAWFTVNQKGFSSKTSSSSESNDKFMDRWKANWFAGYPTQIVLNSDDTLSLKINKNSTYGTTAREIRILQEIEDYEKLIGKQCTMSIMLADGTIYSTTKIVPSTGQAESTITFATGKKITFAFDNRNSGMYKNAMWVRFQITSDIYTSSDSYEELKIKAIKLEIGSQSTLAYDTAPNYTTELLKCQRYLQKVTNSSIICMRSMRNNKLWWGEIELPVPMRATPTFTYTSATIDAYATSSTYIESESCTISVTYRAQSLDVSATSSSSGMAGSCGAVYINSGWLDAQL